MQVCERGALVVGIPNPVFLFHFTAFDNLESIFRVGAIKSKNLLRSEGINYVNIACNSIQNKRATTFVCGSEKTLHDYVPFYFAPRSPMLYKIIHKEVPEAEETNQDNFVYLVSSIDKFHGNEFAFTDYQAIVTYASFYTELNNLDKIRWDLICELPHVPEAKAPFCGYCKYFHNRDELPKYVKRKEARLAEFLVLSQVDIGQISIIVVKNSNMKDHIEKLLRKYNIDIKIEVKADWYF